MDFKTQEELRDDLKRLVPWFSVESDDWIEYARSESPFVVVVFKRECDGARRYFINVWLNLNGELTDHSSSIITLSDRDSEKLIRMEIRELSTWIIDGFRARLRNHLVGMISIP